MKLRLLLSIVLLLVVVNVSLLAIPVSPGMKPRMFVDACSWATEAQQGNDCIWPGVQRSIDAYVTSNNILSATNDYGTHTMQVEYMCPFATGVEWYSSAELGLLYISVFRLNDWRLVAYRDHKWEPHEATNLYNILMSGCEFYQFWTD